MWMRRRSRPATRRSSAAPPALALLVALAAAAAAAEPKEAVPREQVASIGVAVEHHAVASPYRMRFAIFVRPGEATFDAVDSVPAQLRRRTLAVRGFDARGMMTGCELIEGVFPKELIERQFADGSATNLHVHFAAPGCYAARVERA